jgi:hypothetical protein
MKTKFRWMLCLALLLSLAVTSVANPVAAQACDPAFVTQTGTVITVKPTSVDDTANLQCAFDLAVAAGPGRTVRLLTGTYHTGLIFVNNFHGTFTGAGSTKTVVTNLPDLDVTPEDVIFDLPSPTNRWPDLVSFVEGDFAISDMAFQIKGDQPTLPWTIFGIDPPLRVLSAAVLVTGEQVSARIERVLVEGEPMPETMFGYNLINGTVYANYFGGPRITGSLTIKNSIFRNLNSGTPVNSPSGASILITRNTFENVFYGMDGGEFLNSRFEFSYNQVNAVMGMDLYTAYTSEDAGSEILIKNNVFRGAIGPAFEQMMGADNKCLFIGNNVQNVTDIGIYLGPATNGCTVVGGSSKTNVLDLGTDNVLVGVNSMGSGVGPVIHPFIRLWK